MLFSQKEAKKVKKASFYKPPILSAFEHNLEVGVILQGLDFLYNKEKKIHLTYYQLMLQQLEILIWILSIIMMN